MNEEDCLDLKRTLTVAPGWRCAAVCCTANKLSNFGGVGPNLIENPLAAAFNRAG